MLAFLPVVPPSVDKERVARAAVSSTLLAALELCRTGEASVEQADRFGPISIVGRRFEKAAAAGEGGRR